MKENKAKQRKAKKNEEREETKKDVEARKSKNEKKRRKMRGKEEKRSEMRRARLRMFNSNVQPYAIWVGSPQDPRTDPRFFPGPSTPWDARRAYAHSGQ